MAKHTFSTLTCTFPTPWSTLSLHQGCHTGFSVWEEHVFPAKLAQQLTSHWCCLAQQLTSHCCCLLASEAMRMDFKKCVMPFLDKSNVLQQSFLVNSQHIMLPASTSDKPRSLARHDWHTGCMMHGQQARQQCNFQMQIIPGVEGMDWQRDHVDSWVAGISHCVLFPHYPHQDKWRQPKQPTPPHHQLVRMLNHPGSSFFPNHIGSHVPTKCTLGTEASKSKGFERA